MENYDSLGMIGEGTYGTVIKCRHKETGQIVAIKKFKESDEDEQVRKTALREVRILKQLKHDNIVNLIEVFRRKGKLYLVFEYVEHTILEELEANPEGMSDLDVKKCTYQLLRGIEYCHSRNVIHRDIKPENLLISKNGVLKLCDFGFARTLAGPGAKYTDYVATRWYRAPELLVGDTEYGKAVDVWAIGCMFAEILNGLPLFPGDSDIDQLFLIVKCFGKLTARQLEIFSKNPLYVGIKIPEPTELQTIESRFSNISKESLSFLKACLHYEPDMRGKCSDLLKHPFFDGFSEWFEQELKQMMEREKQQMNISKQQQQQQNGSKKPKRKSAEKRKERNEVAAAAALSRGANQDDKDGLYPRMPKDAPGVIHTMARLQYESEDSPVLSSSSFFHVPDRDSISSLHLGGLSIGPSSSSSSSSNGITSSQSSISLGGMPSSFDHSNGDADSYFPNLRMTTPRATRLLAFPHVVGAASSVDVDNISSSSSTGPGISASFDYSDFALQQQRKKMFMSVGGVGVNLGVNNNSNNNNNSGGGGGGNNGSNNGIHPLEVTSMISVSHPPKVKQQHASLLQNSMSQPSSLQQQQQQTLLQQSQQQLQQQSSSDVFFPTVSTQFKTAKKKQPSILFPPGFLSTFKDSGSSGHMQKNHGYRMAPPPTPLNPSYESGGVGVVDLSSTFSHAPLPPPSRGGLYSPYSSSLTSAASEFSMGSGAYSSKQYSHSHFSKLGVQTKRH